MGETTKKFNDFMSRPLQDCDIKNVPGVGPVALGKLKNANIDTAEKLVGHFLLLGRDPDKMTNWLQEVCDIRVQEGTKISDALHKKAAIIVTL
jgi:hypothetical protein